MDKKSRNTIIISIVALAIVLITVTYAYFSARITGIESASTISLTAGRMEIVYTEGNEEVVFNNIYPREEAWATKTFTLTGYDTTELAMKYNLGFNVETNTFPDDYLTYDLTLISSTNGTPIATKTGLPINGTGNIIIGTGIFTNADGDTHNYELKIYFKDNGEDQNDAQDAVFNAKVSVVEFLRDKKYVYSLANVRSYDINYNNCMKFMANNYEELTNEQADSLCKGETITIDGENASFDDLVKDRINNDYFVEHGIIENVDAEFTEPSDGTIFSNLDSQYVYSYNQEGCMDGDNCQSPGGGIIRPDLGNHLNSPGWMAIDADGWGVKVSNVSSTTPITDRLYGSINDIPIKSMAYMFYNSQATSIDLSSFDTSSVVNMGAMFMNSKATTLDLSSFDTSNVTNMISMFEDSAATIIDTSLLNTTKVTNMSGMFRDSHATSLDLSSFDTSNVRYMSYMFAATRATTLDLSNFDITKVEQIDHMLESIFLTTVYARNETEANRYCGVALSNTSIYVGSNLICNGTSQGGGENVNA